LLPACEGVSHRDIGDEINVLVLRNDMLVAPATERLVAYKRNAIPQIESKPPEELSLEGGNVTPQQLTAAGEKIFREKGQCTTCHGIGRAGRGPDLAGVGGRAASRSAAPAPSPPRSARWWRRQRGRSRRSR
jgi:hypothetical protein